MAIFRQQFTVPLSEELNSACFEVTAVDKLFSGFFDKLQVFHARHNAQLSN
jgi:hypothetical protein